MQVFVSKPSVALYPGVKVTKDTVLEYENEYVKQTVRDLVLHSVTRAKGENYESTQDTTVYLKEGDVLIFEESDRGYILPFGQSFVTVADAIADLEAIKDIGGEA
jgi:hypothetical protein